MKLPSLILSSLLLAGCSVFGQNDVETAPYTLLEADDTQDIEVRLYESMVLVSTSMPDGSANSAFRKLFNYIGGDNDGATEIAMTAPVIMNDQDNSQEGIEISMTAPVLMNESADSSTMSFVMPRNFTLANTPKPTNPEIKISELTDYKVAAIQFSGTLSDSNVQAQSKLLTDWIDKNGYLAVGQVVTASYNGPFTLPMFRRNEILIEVKQK